MEYITSWERKGIEKGKVEAIIYLLTQQIGQVSDAATKRITQLPLEKIDALLGALLGFKSKADLDRWLRVHAPVRRGSKLKEVAANTAPR
jgi:hypothetical protein